MADYIWTTIGNLDEILDEVGDSKRSKNDILESTLVVPQ